MRKFADFVRDRLMGVVARALHLGFMALGLLAVLHVIGVGVPYDFLFFGFAFLVMLALLQFLLFLFSLACFRIFGRGEES